jgi:hypothetical protein
MAREWTITYNGVAVGNGTAYPIDRQVTVTKGFERSSVEFQFIVSNATEATFEGACSTLETAYKGRNAALTVLNGSSTWLSFSHSANTGFNSRAEILKKDEVGNSGRSRRYTVRIEFEMPASDASGRRESTVNVDSDAAGIRTVTFSGVWTASGGSAARTLYDAQIDAFCAAALASLTGTYEKVGEPRAEHDFDNKLLYFSRQYRELVYNQGSSGLDDVDVVRDDMVIEKQLSAPGDSENITRLAHCVVSYSCWVKKTNTALESKWDSIKGYALSQVQASLGASAIALISERVACHKSTQQITATLEVDAVLSGPVLESDVSSKDYWKSGKVLIPVWEEDPENLKKYDFDGPAKYLRIVTAKRLFLGPAPADALYGIYVPAGFVVMEAEAARKRSYRGLTGYSFDCEEFLQVVTMEKYTPVAAASTGPARIPSVDPHPNQGLAAGVGPNSFGGGGSRANR